MNQILFIKKELNIINPEEPNILFSHTINASELFQMSRPQLAAKSEVLDRWKFAEPNSPEFIKIFNTNLNHLADIDPTEKNKYLFLKAAVDKMTTLQTKLADLRNNDASSCVVRFDGEIDNQNGYYLIEFPRNQLTLFINHLKQLKSYPMDQKIPLEDLINFYDDIPASPFENFNLNEYRYLFLPYN